MGIILILRTAALRIALVTALLAVAGCSTDDDRGGARRQIVATTDILGHLVERVVEGSADVTVLIPSGTDAHEFEPSPKQVAALREADVVVANEAGYEEHLDDVLDDLGDRLFRVDIPLVRADGDPHWWMDPLRATQVAERLAEALAARPPVTVVRSIERAHDEVTAILDTVAPGDRKLVTDHEVLGYFAGRYGFEVVGAVVPSVSSQASAGAEQIARLARTMEREGVSTVFVGTSGSDRLARALARELGDEAQVVRLPGESLGGHATYEQMILDVATRIAEALG